MNAGFNEKLIAYLVLICGLTVSSVAVYYSVIGLTAIFAAAVIPVIIMGTVLEISKLVATVWLKQHWTVAPKLLRAYLVTAVILLMLITSMGIFGFLSRAHIEQTSDTAENQAKLQTIVAEIGRQQQLVSRNEQRIQQIETGNTGQDATLQRQIDLEQSRIDQILKRQEPAIQEQNNIISSRTKIYSEQLERIDQDLGKLQTNLSAGNITQVQSQVGVQPDGQLGPRSRQAIDTYRDRLTAQRTEITRSLQQVENDPVVTNARKEIQRIRSSYEQQVAQSNQLISRLQSQLGKGESNIDQQVSQLRTAITESTQTIEKLSNDKFQIESAVRKLEAELGPIKYMAKFVYGDQTDRDLLEKAVSWMIILLIVVFDPLAVILLLASQISFQLLKNPPLKTQLDPQHHAVDSDIVTPKEDEFDLRKHAYLFKPFRHFTANYPLTQPSVKQEQVEPVDDVKTEIHTLDQNQWPNTDDIDEDSESLEEKEATRIWKQVNPTKTLKDQRDKFAAGIIAELPWQKLITPLHVEKFGVCFPDHSTDGDLFCRVDMMPTAIYKFFNHQWIEIDKSNRHYYTFGSDYIDWLIDQIANDGYDPDIVSDNEKTAIKTKLSK